jgi:hypothetical protein
MGEEPGALLSSRLVEALVVSVDADLAGVPVTTPTAKLSPKILTQNRAARVYFSSPVRRARHFQYTRNHAKPMVNWGTGSDT